MQALAATALIQRPLAAQRAALPMLMATNTGDRLSSLQERRSKLLADLAEVDTQIRLEVPAQDTIIGSASSVFEPSFGYLSRSAGVYTESASASGTKLPSSALDLAQRNFKRELKELKLELLETFGGTPEELAGDDEPCDPIDGEMRDKLDELTLDNDAIWAREEARPPVKAPLVLLAPYYALCWVLDSVFEGRPIARFWFLETVARMPYFAYVSCLHLYETLGWWRRSASTKRVHFAEEWNEFHHLLIMEALGGDQRWSDRFLAQHAAIVYYWILIFLWLLSPSLSYNFSELIEAHAVDSYGEFVDANRELLEGLPAPQIAKLYYGEDLYFFDEFQTSSGRGVRRPPCDTLLDVFTNIRDDEAEHVATMADCQDPSVTASAPFIEVALLAAVALAAAAFGFNAGDEVAIESFEAEAGAGILAAALAAARELIDRVIGGPPGQP